jgi:hypothetical protein
LGLLSRHEGHSAVLGAPDGQQDAALLAEEALNRHRLLRRMADDYREDLNELDVDHGARPAA